MVIQCVDFKYTLDPLNFRIGTGMIAFGKAVNSRIEDRIFDIIAHRSPVPIGYDLIIEMVHLDRSLNGREYFYKLECCFFMIAICCKQSISINVKYNRIYKTVVRVVVYRGVWLLIEYF